MTGSPNEPFTRSEITKRLASYPTALLVTGVMVWGMLTAMDSHPGWILVIGLPGIVLAFGLVIYGMTGNNLVRDVWRFIKRYRH